MKRSIILIVVLVAAASVFLGWRYVRRNRDKEPVLSGTIEARDIQVGSLVGGRVAAVHVDEGDTVTEGQPLVTLEPDLLDPQIRQQQAQVEAARARLVLARKGPREEEVARARLEYENAERERQRLEKLLEEGIIGQQQYDEAATAAATRRQILREAERGSRPEEIKAAEAALQAEQERLAYLLRQRAETVVRSPAAGIIESMDLRPGDLVAPNQPVAEILEPDQLWVRVYVPEPKLGLVRVGQPATLTVDTYPGRKFPGRVVEINSRAEYTPRNVQTLEQRMDQVFGVKVEVERAPELKPGMAALVRLEPMEAASR